MNCCDINEQDGLGFNPMATPMFLPQRRRKERDTI
jgi:hypothetical protein